MNKFFNFREQEILKMNFIVLSDLYIKIIVDCLFNTIRGFVLNFKKNSVKLIDSNISIKIPERVGKVQNSWERRQTIIFTDVSRLPLKYFMFVTDY